MLQSGPTGPIISFNACSVQTHATFREKSKYISDPRMHQWLFTWQCFRVRRYQVINVVDDLVDDRLQGPVTHADFLPCYGLHLASGPEYVPSMF